MTIWGISKREEVIVSVAYIFLLLFCVVLLIVSPSCSRVTGRFVRSSFRLTVQEARALALAVLAEREAQETRYAQAEAIRFEYAPPAFSQFTYIFGSSTAPGIDPWADVEAEVVCLRCKAMRWVPYADRQAGAQRPPKGVEAKASARCQGHHDENWTAWTGKTRIKK